ncbi:MAG TPA: TIGR03667 family PPOX class F420-dependent oxidoreductase [Ktedonobacteraceae bacterium]|nr:TIGR03667 family PPOX class F420-dependent oxidoreductase [Ktedonobacteraceae bacterium]
MSDQIHPKNAHVDQRLRSDLIIWLTTVRPDGRPHMVAVWFLWDGEQFLIFSQPNTQKVRNLRHSSHVTLALDNTDGGEDVIVIDGEAELLTDPDINATLAAYKQKYAADFKEMNTTAEEMAKSYSQGIRVRPTKFY